MNLLHIRHCAKIVLVTAAVAFAPVSVAQVTVVNMIPNSMSDEVGRDSEPNVAVNPFDPQQIAASTLSTDPALSGNAPIFVSTDGGQTWALNVILPGGSKTNDTTLRFGTISNVLYAGILRGDGTGMDILRKSNFTTAGLATVLLNRSNEDQPYVDAATLLRGSATDRVYVGHNDFNAAGGQTASVEESLDAAATVPPAGLSTVRLEPRATTGQDAPPIRPAFHLDGTIYAAYIGWRTGTTATGFTADIVVTRDDNWGSGATPFTALIDPGDALSGVRVATGVSLPPFGNLLGTQRQVASQLSIAVDPRDSQTVYVAWADGATTANYTVHVRRSLDGGATWTADLRAISPATNPALAVTTQGTVGLLYQKLTSPAAGDRWETHLETSTDGFATAPTDLLLADAPDANGAYAGTNPIGDYVHLTAVGKNFSGVFSANNTADSSNFPNGVNYLRNVDWVTQQLRDVTNTSNVNVSIDPFFVHAIGVPSDDDFYVRDWTDSVASGDTGLEPSTHPVFYQTSDVWNRRGTLPGTFTNDQPDNEDAGNGAGNIGDNWAFARIRRNTAPPAGSQTVTAHFLVSKLGTGSNYVDAGSADPDVTFVGADPTVVFGPGDAGPTITAAYPWHLNAVTSTHLCLAVEISTPTDPLVAPSLLGSAPGWPTVDLRVINDNNKAQRNMGLSTTAARGVGAMDSFYAIAHNAATWPRDMVLRYKVPERAMRGLGKARIEIIGQQPRSLAASGEIVLKGMQPGENRWVGLSFQADGGKEGELFDVRFDEMVGGVTVNGFTIAAQVAPTEIVIRDRVELHRSVFTRLGYGFGVKAARQSVEAADKLLAQDRIDSKTYLKFVETHVDGIGDLLQAWLKSAKERRDLFGISDAVTELRKSMESMDAERIAVSHSALLNKVDSFATMRQLLKGDTADILQNVRWHNDLYRRADRLAATKSATDVRKRLREFIRDYSARKIGNKEYATLIGELLDAFRALAKEPELAELKLDKHIGAMEKNLEDPTALQRAHRGLLLALQPLERR